jgi:hypothetical protein
MARKRRRIIVVGAVAVAALAVVARSQPSPLGPPRVLSTEGSEHEGDVAPRVLTIVLHNYR